MPNTDPNITAQIETFTQQIVATVEAAVAQRIQAALARRGSRRKGHHGQPDASASCRCGACPKSTSTSTSSRSGRPCWQSGA
jgi:hypothetical protein